MIYTSRYSNPKLRSGEYIAVRISLGTPKWALGYKLHGEMKALMPFGLFGGNLSEQEFRKLYRQKLNNIGVQKIAAVLNEIRRKHGSKDIVLLCYEDVRKEDNWCHRTVFADWWRDKTGEVIEELHDTAAVRSKPSKARLSGDSDTNTIPYDGQLTLF